MHSISSRVLRGIFRRNDEHWIFWYLNAADARGTVSSNAVAHVHIKSLERSRCWRLVKICFRGKTIQEDTKWVCGASASAWLWTLIVIRGTQIGEQIGFAALRLWILLLLGSGAAGYQCSNGQRTAPGNTCENCDLGYFSPGILHSSYGHGVPHRTLQGLRWCFHP